MIADDMDLPLVFIQSGPIYVRREPRRPFRTNDTPRPSISRSLNFNSGTILVRNAYQMS
jgi:hypothetical protein